jgi:hypothetical protein
MCFEDHVIDHRTLLADDAFEPANGEKDYAAKDSDVSTDQAASEYGTHHPEKEDADYPARSHYHSHIMRPMTCEANELSDGQKTSQPDDDLLILQIRTIACACPENNQRADWRAERHTTAASAAPT